MVFVRGWGEDDFIGLGLGGMGYSYRSYKNIISNCKFIRDRFQIGILKINILQVVMFQNVFMDSKILKEKQIFFFFNVFWNLCVLSNQIEYSCLSSFINMLTCNFIQMWICAIALEYVENSFKSLTCF